MHFSNEKKMLMESVLVVYEGSVYEIWCSVY